MLSVSFICLKSRQNKSGQSPIQLWVNVDGSRATTILSLRVALWNHIKSCDSSLW